MGFREKVALATVVITLLQITLVYCSNSGETQNSDSGKQKQKRNLDTAAQPSLVVTLRPYIQDPNTRSQLSAERSHETIRNTFNFPDVEYPTASTPRTPYRLQETNILQRNAIQRPAEYLPSTTAAYPTNVNRISIKYNNKKHAKYRSSQSSGVTIPFPEFGTTPKPFCFREEGAFPEVEYPLSARDIWKPNYWKQFANSEPNNDIYNNERNGISQVDFPSNSNSIKMTKSKNIKSNYLNTKPASTTPTPTTPFVLTPYTTLYFNTTPAPIDPVDTGADDKKNTTSSVKKALKKKKAKKKFSKTENGLATTITTSPMDGNYLNSNTYCMETTPLPNKALQVTNIQENLFTVMSDDHISEDNLSEIDTCPNISNDTLPYMYVVTTTPSYNLCSGDVTTVSSLTIYNDDETLPVSDNNNASTSDAINTIVTENRDNKESYFEDNARNSNKSSTCDDNTNTSSLSSREDANDLPTDDCEFTTDVIPDFDENMLSVFKTITSTLSPMNLIAIDEAWKNSEVIEPYKSVAYPDELDQYYIAVL